MSYFLLSGWVLKLWLLTLLYMSFTIYHMSTFNLVRLSPTIFGLDSSCVWRGSSCPPSINFHSCWRKVIINRFLHCHIRINLWSFLILNNGCWSWLQLRRLVKTLSEAEVVKLLAWRLIRQVMRWIRYWLFIKILIYQQKFGNSLCLGNVLRLLRTVRLFRWNFKVRRLQLLLYWIWFVFLSDFWYWVQWVLNHYSTLVIGDENFLWSTVLVISVHTEGRFRFNVRFFNCSSYKWITYESSRRLVVTDLRSASKRFLHSLIEINLWSLLFLLSICFLSLFKIWLSHISGWCLHWRLSFTGNCCTRVWKKIGSLSSAYCICSASLNLINNRSTRILKVQYFTSGHRLLVNFGCGTLDLFFFFA